MSTPEDTSKQMRALAQFSGQSYEDSENGVRAPPMFNPLWLRKSVLFGFAALFVALAVILAVIFHISNQDNGFSTNLSTNHYIWNYG
jgi:hypothetical protein